MDFLIDSLNLDQTVLGLFDLGLHLSSFVLLFEPYGGSVCLAGLPAALSVGSVASAFILEVFLPLSIFP